MARVSRLRWDRRISQWCQAGLLAARKRERCAASAVWLAEDWTGWGRSHQTRMRAGWGTQARASSRGSRPVGAAGLASSISAVAGSPWQAAAGAAAPARRVGAMARWEWAARATAGEAALPPLAAWVRPASARVAAGVAAAGALRRRAVRRVPPEQGAARVLVPVSLVGSRWAVVGSVRSCGWVSGLRTPSHSQRAVPAGIAGWGGASPGATT